ncbi:MAG TPA: DUF6072 family protein [Pyrinomonadaceae bacterium]
MPNNTDDLQGAKEDAVRFASEYVVPGGSHIVKGDYKQAGLHVVAGFAAKYFFGVPGLLLVSANSIVKAKTGRHIHEHLNLGGGGASDTPASDDLYADNASREGR